MYQLILESFLGLRRNGNVIWFEPCVPYDWHSFSVRYKYLDTWYNIRIYQGVTQSEAVVTLDGHETKDNKITMTNDRQVHTVIVQSRSTTVVADYPG
jgi:cellobiose phosphorylase